MCLFLFQLLDAQQIHPDAYIQFLQPTLELAVRYSFTEAGHGKATRCMLDIQEGSNSGEREGSS